MIANLNNSLIFLHGLSGSGKSETHRKLAEQYSSHGYKAIYVSSGALFRAALSDPIIAEQVATGYFLDTLGVIIPGIETAFDHFIEQWVQSDGKAVIILDGLIRRSAFVNKNGLLIPSQIEQVSYGIHNAIRKFVSENKDSTEHFPEYNTPNNENEENLITGAKQMLKDAIHIVADVLPDDAEVQMKKRADKEIHAIRSQLQDRVVYGKLDANKMQRIEDYISKLEAILHGGVKKDGENLVYTSRLEWNDHIDRNLYLSLAAEVKSVKNQMSDLYCIFKDVIASETEGEVTA